METKYRKICTKIPVPESIPLLKRLRAVQPHSLDWQAPIIWEKAEGYNVFDKYGNKWLDMSSGIVVASAGHARQEVLDAVKKQIDNNMVYNFTFPSEIRLKLLEKLMEITPDNFSKGFLLSSGSEATENALKLMRGWALRTVSKDKNVIVSFENAFHGRTLGSQLMGGLPGLKDWIINRDPDIVQVPFPDGFINEDLSFSTFENSLREQGVDFERVAGVIVEGFQGANVDFLPREYAQSLSKWCKENNALLTLDEVQSGFGRTGKMWAFEHFGIVPDVMCLGKALSGMLPISAALTRPEIIDVFEPGEMTSTFTGNPLSCAAALANIDIFEKEKLVEKAAALESVMMPAANELVEKYDFVGRTTGKGAIVGLGITKPNSKEGDKSLAYDINQKLYEKGVMVFAPVGRGCIKIAPPFVMPEEAIREGFNVIDQAMEEIKNA